MRLTVLLLVGLVACSGAWAPVQAVACTPGLSVGGKQYEFDGCSVQEAMQSDEIGYSNLQVHTALEADGANGSRLRVGLAAKTKGWVGWGLGDGMMGDRVIAWFDGKGAAQVAGFYIESMLDEDVNAAKGSFKIEDAAVQVANGELRAVFTLPQPDTPVKQAAGEQLMVFAMGPMGAKTAPGLQYHAVYSYGMLPIKAPPAPAAPAAEPKPAEPKPAAAKAPAAKAPTPAPVPKPKPAVVQAAPAPEPAPTTSGCSLDLGQGGGRQAFTGCSLVDMQGSSMHLMWKSEPLASNPKLSLLTLGLNSSEPAGYIAVGFPSSPGQMVGANAVILQPCQQGEGCTNGAALQQWYLGGELQADVQQSSNLALSNVAAAALPGGALAGTFSLQVDTPAGGRRRGLLAQPTLLQAGTDMPLIFAAGPVVGGVPRRHVGTAAEALPLLAQDGAGAGAATVQGAADDDKSSLKAAHAWLAAIGWGVLVPVGIVLARGFKAELSNGRWFHLHRACQSLGFVMGTVALGLGFAINDGNWSVQTDDQALHRNMGVACTVLGATQLTAAVWRPAKDAADAKGARLRLFWQNWHAWVGRAATAVAIANIYIGTIHMWDLGAWAWACYTAVLALIVGVGVAKEVHNWRRARGQTYQKAFDTSAHSSARAQDAEAGAGPARADASAKVSTAGSFQSKAF